MAFYVYKKGGVNLKKWYYPLAIFLGGCCYGILSTLVKLAYSAGFSVNDVTGSQYFFGTIIVWIIVLFTRKERLTLKQILKLLLCGIPLAATGLFYYQSLKTLDASLTVICLFQFVWIGTLFECILNKKRPTKEELVSIVILIIGSALAANIFGLKGSNVQLQGIIWGLLSALTYAILIYVSAAVEKDTPPVLKTAFFSIGAVIIILSLFRPTFLFEKSSLISIAPYGVILGIFGVALPQLLFSIGMPQVGPGLGTILPASELPVAIILSSVVLQENVTCVQWVGVFLILFGIVVGNIKNIKLTEMSHNAS